MCVTYVHVRTYITAFSAKICHKSEMLTICLKIIPLLRYIEMLVCLYTETQAGNKNTKSSAK